MSASLLTRSSQNPQPALPFFQCFEKLLDHRNANIFRPMGHQYRLSILGKECRCPEFIILPDDHGCIQEALLKTPEQN
jgi:hypothetical protein